MKTTVFNFNRVGLLFRRYFTEHFRIELIYWSIMVIVFMFMRNVTPLMLLLILIAGAFYAGRFSGEIHSRSNGIAYFMIPATQLEKLIVGIIMTSVFYFSMMIIVYIIGNLLGTFLNNILANMNFLFFFHHSPLQWKLFNIDFLMDKFYNKPGYYSVLLFMFFLCNQSLYFLGGIYFTRFQTLITYLVNQVIGSFLLVLFVIEMLLVYGNVHMFTGVNLPYSFGKMIGDILHVSLYLLPLFFWVVSYFRLTEKQV